MQGQVLEPTKVRIAWVASLASSPASAKLLLYFEEFKLANTMTSIGFARGVPSRRRWPPSPPGISGRHHTDGAGFAGAVPEPVVHAPAWVMGSRAPGCGSGGAPRAEKYNPLYIRSGRRRSADQGRFDSKPSLSRPEATRLTAFSDFGGGAV